MAVLTVLLQDGKNVFIKRDLGAGIFWRRGGNCNYCRQQRGKADASHAVPRGVNAIRSAGFGCGSDAILFSSLRTDEDTLLKEKNSHVEKHFFSVVSNWGRPGGGLLVWTD